MNEPCCQLDTEIIFPNEEALVILFCFVCMTLHLSESLYFSEVFVSHITNNGLKLSKEEWIFLSFEIIILNDFLIIAKTISSWYLSPHFLL